MTSSGNGVTVVSGEPRRRGRGGLGGSGGARALRRFVLVGCTLIAALVAVVVLRAATVRSRQVPVPAASLLDLDLRAAAERFAGSLRFATVSNDDPESTDWQQFRGLQAYLEAQFPLVHERLEREMVGGYTIVHKWTGSDPSLPPVVLLSHQDVVPVEPGTEGKWTQPPFGGRIADGYVWGRGALDDKCGLVGLLQAAELLLARGFQPKRTFLLVFGHDEEVGGERGAKVAAELLASRGVRAEFVLDEGGALMRDAIPGLKRRAAMVGTAEKGSVTLFLTADADGGHSSTPPEHTAVGLVSAAVARLEANQMPMALQGPVRQMLDYLTPEIPFVPRLALANLWLTQPILERFAASEPAMAAVLRTTTAATMIHGGVKENVLPSSARAVVNFRTQPGDSADDVVAHARHVIADDRVRVELSGGEREATEASPVDGTAFGVLQRSIGEVFPDALVVPFLVLGGTDSRHFTNLTDRVYRFTPIDGVPDTLKRVHGTDERMSVENYAQAVQFFARLFVNAGS